MAVSMIGMIIKLLPRFEGIYSGTRGDRIQISILGLKVWKSYTSAHPRQSLFTFDDPCSLERLLFCSLRGAVRNNRVEIRTGTGVRTARGRGRGRGWIPPPFNQAGRMDKAGPGPWTLAPVSTSVVVPVSANTKSAHLFKREVLAHN